MVIEPRNDVLIGPPQLPIELEPNYIQRNHALRSSLPAPPLQDPGFERVDEIPFFHEVEPDDTMQKYHRMRER